MLILVSTNTVLLELRSQLLIYVLSVADLQLELRSCNRDLMAFLLRPNNIIVCVSHILFSCLSFPSVELQDMVHISQVKQEGLKPGSSPWRLAFLSSPSPLDE